MKHDHQFIISERLTRARRTKLYERTPKDPRNRRLKVYSISPAVSRMESGIGTAIIPFEPLTPGPVGSVIEVINTDENGESWTQVDLDKPSILMSDGLDPSLANPKFHQQMVYAIAMMTYHRFSAALGRNVAWSFAGDTTDTDDNADPNGSKDKPGTRLKLYPHGKNAQNAWYDPLEGKIVFGYYKAQRSTAVVKKGQGYIFTSISHDVIAHEMSHALIDGLRSHFLVPTHKDVLAFHEALSDLVAFFQHFEFEAVVAIAIGRYRGKLEASDVLVEIAAEFGRGMADGGGQALRTLLDPADESGQQNDSDVLLYSEAGDAPHNLGRVLARAVFDAYLIIYKRRTKRLIKLATGGTGQLGGGSLPAGLKQELVKEAQRIAKQFFAICVRAIDYCPPVDVRFGDYLRAMITADFDVVPEDKWGYREAIVRAFGERGIYGEGTQSMAEDELLWNRPKSSEMPIVEELSLGSMKLDGDPAKPTDEQEMRKQAEAIGKLVCNPKWAEEFGLVSPADERFQRDGYTKPVIESVRTSRRAGPDRHVVFDTVAEVVQSRIVTLENGNTLEFYGGSTLIFGPVGELRLIVRKRVDKDIRLDEQKEFMSSWNGAKLWKLRGNDYRPVSNLAQCMCEKNSV